MLLGVTRGDDAAAACRLARKIWELRILDDGRSAANVGHRCSSSASSGCMRTPGRAGARRGPQPLPQRWPRRCLRRSARRSVPLGAKVQTGVFGAMMQVSSVDDGPVTLLLES